MTVYLCAIFLLAAFLGYFVVWSVSPSLHSPLMSVSNAISGVVVLGAIQVAGKTTDNLVLTLSLFAVFWAAVNLSGGFVISNRMVQLFRKKEKK